MIDMEQLDDDELLRRAIAMSLQEKEEGKGELLDMTGGKALQ